MGFFRYLLYFGVLLYVYHRAIGLPAVNYALKVKTVKELGHKYSMGTYVASNIRRDFQKQYPKSILKEDDFVWLPCSTGGLRGSVSVLYVSFTELLVLYHAEMEATGSSGRHYMNISATVLEGGMTVSTHSSKLKPVEKLSPGSKHVFRIGTSSNVKLSAGTTLLIYGRGFVPLTMGYWISEPLFVDHDPLLVISTLWFYIKAVFMSQGAAMDWINQILNAVWRISYEGLDYLLFIPQMIVNFFNGLFAI